LEKGGGRGKRGQGRDKGKEKKRARGSGGVGPPGKKKNAALKKKFHFFAHPLFFAGRRGTTALFSFSLFFLCEKGGEGHTGGFRTDHLSF